jgi:hypothetical protein
MCRIRFLPWLILLGASVLTPLHAETAEQLYAKFAAQPVAGACLDVLVDLEASPGFSVETTDSGVELRYRMAFNNIAEGWSWQPGADPQVEDYYRFKYLPLQSVAEERTAYQAEDKIGVAQSMRVSWRYDYFLAFDNLYDFFPRSVDDDAGFAVNLGQRAPVSPGLRARLCLQEPVTSESTTFWKATYSNPVDFTLKKRYLIGKLQALHFFDRDNGQELAVLSARSAKCLICAK